MSNQGHIYYFDGPDAAGKTTAALNLAKYKSAVYTHHGLYQHIPFDDTRGKLFDLYASSLMPAVSGRSNLVLDRFFLSEAAYGEAVRSGQSRLDEHEIRQLITLMNRGYNHATLIICLPPFNEVKKNFVRDQKQKAKVEYLKNLETLEKVYELFLEMVHNWTAMACLDGFVYDYTKGHSIVDSVEEFHRLKNSTGRSGRIEVVL